MVHHLLSYKCFHITDVALQKGLGARCMLTLTSSEVHSDEQSVTCYLTRSDSLLLLLLTYR